jgi:hypothetical protein
MTATTTKAVVIRKPGSPDVLAIEERQVSQPALWWPGSEKERAELSALVPSRNLALECVDLVASG